MVPDKQKVWTDGRNGRTTPKLYSSDFVRGKQDLYLNEMSVDTLRPTVFHSCRGTISSRPMLNQY